MWFVWRVQVVWFPDTSGKSHSVSWGDGMIQPCENNSDLALRLITIAKCRLHCLGIHPSFSVGHSKLQYAVYRSREEDADAVWGADLGRLKLPQILLPTEISLKIYKWARQQILWVGFTSPPFLYQHHARKIWPRHLRAWIRKCSNFITHIFLFLSISLMEMLQAKRTTFHGDFYFMWQRNM